MKRNPKSSKNRILLVEDSQFMAEVTSMYLENHGFSVCHVTSGEEAVRRSSEDKTFNLILMDIDLGDGINGLEAAGKILTINDTPIIFLSSHAETEYIKKARQISRYGYIIKNGGHYALLKQAIDLSGLIYELYQLHKLKIDFQEQINTQLKNTLIIAGICDTKLKYTWINNPHPDFDFNASIGRNDVEIIRNEGTEKLYDFKKKILTTGDCDTTNIHFPLSTGILAYSIKGFPLMRNETEIIGVKTVSLLR